MLKKYFIFFYFYLFYEKKSLKNLKKFELPNGVKIDSIHIELSQKFNFQFTNSTNRSCTMCAMDQSTG